jgi:hypothetical protein
LELNAIQHDTTCGIGEEATRADPHRTKLNDFGTCTPQFFDYVEQIFGRLFVLRVGDGQPQARSVCRDSPDEHGECISLASGLLTRRGVVTAGVRQPLFSGLEVTDLDLQSIDPTILIIKNANQILLPSPRQRISSRVRLKLNRQAKAEDCQ